MPLKTLYLGIRRRPHSKILQIIILSTLNEKAQKVSKKKKKNI